MILPLRQWITSEQHHPVPQREEKNQSLLRGSIVAFGVAHLLNRLHRNGGVSSPDGLRGICSADNFAVCLSLSTAAMGSNGQTRMDVVGVDMISPKLSLRLVDPSSLNRNIYDGSGNIAAGTRQLGFEIVSHCPLRASNIISDEKVWCHLLGVLLYEIFSNKSLFPARSIERLSISDSDGDLHEKPSQKKSARKSGAPCQQRSGAATDSESQQARHSPRYETLLDLGFPAPINTIVENLLECGWERNSGVAYSSLEVVFGDIQSMIVEPHRFLCNHHLNVGQNILQFREDKLYGRQKECQLLAESFSRVVSGAREAFFIRGASGAGKTKLVERLISQVNSNGGFIVEEKFDLMHQEPYSTILAAFNALCCNIKEHASPQDLQDIAVKIMAEFYSDFIWLAKILPNIYVLLPQLRSTYSGIQINTQMTLHSVGFILQRFMKVVGSTGKYTILFLDDLQWSDAIALELVEAVVCNEDGSHFLFAGCFRNKEADSVLVDAIHKLKASNTPTTTVDMDGLSRTDLNLMISDTLCLFPRQCLSLSELVFQNTQGNPLFIREFLQSLVNSKVIQYSLSEKRWVWDINQSQSASLSSPSDDVLELLSSKICNISNRCQIALKTMACFGSKVNEIVVQSLNATPNFPNFTESLDELVEEGLLTKNGKEFKFFHDKIREACLTRLFTEEDKDSYHFWIASLLLSVCNEENFDSIAYLICDQFKISNILNREQPACCEISHFFVKAGSKALKTSEFPRARSYLEIAEKLLPPDHWKDQYGFCLQLFYQLARSSYACGLIGKARDALKQIIDEGQSLNDKLDAYYLMVAVLCSCNEMSRAYATGCDVISQLHDPIPSSISPQEVGKMVNDTVNLLDTVSDHGLKDQKEADSTIGPAIKFYSLMCTVSYLVKPQMSAVFVCRAVKCSVEHGISPYSALAFSNFSAMFCTIKALANVAVARRIGKIAMSFQERYDLSEQMPNLYTTHYGSVGPYCEPLQSVADMHLIGFDLGMAAGDTSVAFYNTLYYVRTAFFSGVNLNKLIKKCEYYLKLADKFGNLHLKVFLEMWRRALLTLTGETPAARDVSSTGFTPTQAKTHSLIELIQTFWVGHVERFEYLYKKHAESKEEAVNTFSNHLILFFYAVNCSPQKKKSLRKAKAAISQVLAEMEEMAEFSSWNFQHRVELLKALLYSTQKKHAEAEVSYAVAISTAHDSKFVHEEGLACELAGFHFHNAGDTDKALVHFNQSRACYEKWGSQVKIDFISKEIKKLERNINS